MVRTPQRSNITAPLKYGARTTGALVVVRPEARPYSPVEVAIRTAFAPLAATAIETAQAQRALAERTREVTRALERQKATAEIMALVGASLDRACEWMAGSHVRSDLDRSNNQPVQIRTSDQNRRSLSYQ